MCTMSRERQWMCLAQRGVRRKGSQKGVVRNYVAEMANNLWATKYKAFGIRQAGCGGAGARRVLSSAPVKGFRGA